jgi:transposase
MSAIENSTEQISLEVSERPEGNALRFLHLLLEQNAITVGQLARFLRVSRSEMKRFVAEAVDEKWVAARQSITGDDEWVWLDYRGAELTGSRFQVVMPGFKDLRNWRALNEARLKVEGSSRDVEWTCKRKMQATKRSMGRLPDAIVRIGKQRHVVEVELSYKKGKRLRAKIAEYERKYDGVLYFVPDEILKQFERLEITKKAFPKLMVVPISVDCLSLDQPQWRVGIGQLPQVGDVESPLSELELEGIDLLAEQGAIPRDQLARFLKLSVAETDRLIARFVGMELVECAKPLVDEPYWAWLTSIGARWSSWDLAVGAPGLGGLERSRSLNELRLRATRDDRVRWTSDRVLRGRYRLKGSCPDAVVGVGAENHAFDLILYAGNSAELKTRLQQRLKKYRVLVWFYTPEAQADLEKFAARVNCRALRIRPVPESPYLTARAWNRKRSARNGVAYCSNPKNWADFARGTPAVMYPIVEETVPEGAVKVIAVAAASERTPRVLKAWKRKIGGYPTYYIETDVGKFRVVNAEADWIADEVAREDVFVREGGPAVDVRRGGWGQIPTGPLVESKEARVSDEIWAAVGPEIPPIRGRRGYRGTNPMPDRDVVAALIWQVKEQANWQRTPVGLVDGARYRVLARLREWEHLGVWAKVQSKLEELLPGGRDLDWAKLEPASLAERWPFNDRQRAFLARALKDPERAWSVEEYSASFGTRPDSGKGDLWKLAALGLVVHKRGLDGFVFEPVDDFMPKLRQLLQRKGSE